MINQICSFSLALEPLIVEFKGELICVVTIGGESEPCPDNRVFAFRSKDYGKTWSGGVMIYTNERACYANSMNVIDEKIFVSMIVHDGDFWNMKCVTIVSEDGYNWAESDIFSRLYDWTLIRPMTTLKDGTILIPYHSYPVKGNERVCLQGVMIREANKDFKNIECFILSQPEGWRSMSKETIDGTLGWIWTEPSIVELSGGELVMLMRWDNTGWIWKSVSKDRGLTWSYPEKTSIPNSTCKAQAINCGDKIALINVPNNKEIVEEGAFYAKRWPLEVWVSDDDMASWGEKIRLTDFPGEFHYPNGYYKDGKLIFVIEHNRHTVLFLTYDLK